MSDPKKIAPENIDGDFFVDTSCISCGNCRDLAPLNFKKAGHFYVISKQPNNAQELDDVLNALVCCPLGSIGSHSKQDIASVIKRFPELIEDDVYYLGFNSPASFGGKSYFIAHSDGNWMVDSPKFSSRLVQYIKNKGGLKYIFLTHRDDVAEAAAYAREFGAKRIIHKADLEAQKDAEIIFDGIESFDLEPDFKVIPTPGHTMGHSMLLFKNKFLFSGDVFTSKIYHGEDIETWPPFYCWCDWDEQTRSIERLLNYSFQIMLPSHGRRFSGTVEQTRKALKQTLDRCRLEKDIDPKTLERSEFYSGISKWAKDTGQWQYAEFTAGKALSIRNSLGIKE